MATSGNRDLPPRSLKRNAASELDAEWRQKVLSVFAHSPSEQHMQTASSLVLCTNIRGTMARVPCLVR